jgi:hypothetical protein
VWTPFQGLFHLFFALLQSFSHLADLWPEQPVIFLCKKPEIEKI